MITTIEGKKTIIKFAYDGNATGCGLYDFETKENFGIAVVTRHSKDKPNRVKARKAALAKALKPYSREIRTAVWNDVARQMRMITV